MKMDCEALFWEPLFIFCPFLRWYFISASYSDLFLFVNMQRCNMCSRLLGGQVGVTDANGTKIRKDNINKNNSWWLCYPTNKKQSYFVK